MEIIKDSPWYPLLIDALNKTTVLDVVLGFLGTGIVIFLVRQWKKRQKSATE